MQHIDEQLLQNLKRVLSFQNLSRNNFLLKKFDPIIGCIRLTCLIKENSLRQQIEFPGGMQNLMNILIEYNFKYWICDQNFQTLTPIFNGERKQIQILIKKNKVEEFKNYLQELKIKQEWDPREQEYVPNKEMIKLFIVCITEEDAQDIFSKIQQSKTIYGIQNAKMEQVDYVPQLLKLVAIKKQQYQEQRMKQINFEDRNQEDFQQYQQQQYQQQQHQQYQQYQQQQEQDQQKNTQHSDIVIERLNQIRMSEKVELNFAPLEEQQSRISFMPVHIQSQFNYESYEQQSFQPQIKQEEQTQQIQQEQEQIIPIIEEKQPTRETESNKENSVEKNNKRNYDNNNIQQQYQKTHPYQNRYQQNGYQKRRNNYDSGYQNKYYDNQNNNRKPQHHYNRLEDDLREFTGFKKYQQRPQKEYYEPKKES